MANRQDQKIERAERVLKALDEDLITYDEAKELLDTLIDFVREAREDLEEQHDGHVSKVSGALAGFLKDVEKIDGRFKDKISASKSEVLKDIERIEKKLIKRINAVRDEIPEIPDAPEMPDLQPVYDRIEEVREELLNKMTAEDIRDLLETLEGDERLDISAIRGLEEFLAEHGGKNTVRSTGVGSAGGGRGLFLYVGGVKKGIVKELNFEAGTGMSISFALINGRPTLTFESSGGGGGVGITPETPPEPVDGVTTVFTVSANPQSVVADGQNYYEGFGYTYAAGQITMDIAPSQYVRALVAGGATPVVETPPESANAVNTNFTVSAQPRWVVSDGTTYYEGFGYSYSTGTITLDTPPSQFIRAII